MTRKETSTGKEKAPTDSMLHSTNCLKHVEASMPSETENSASEPEKRIKVKCPVCYLHFISEGQNDMIGEEGYYRSVKGLFTKMTMFRFKCENCCREWELKMVMHL